MEKAQTAVLEVERLSCSRDDRLLFSGLNFSLGCGEALLLEGGNGSGKTTLLRILCGFRDADEGEIRWGGARLADSDYYADMAYVGHADGVKKELTVLENLRFALALGKPGRYGMARALEKVRLAGFDDNPAHTLSAGQKRRLSLARLLISHAVLWILDEPFTSLDRQGIELIESLITAHVQEGGMAILTSHQELSLPHLPLRCIRLDSCH